MFLCLFFFPSLPDVFFIYYHLITTIFSIESHLLWCGSAADFIAVLSISEGLKEIAFSGIHSDGDDPVVGFPQLGVIAEQIVVCILVR